MACTCLICFKEIPIECLEWNSILKTFNFFTSFLGEVVKTGDLKCVFGEGMPTYRNPFEKGKLIIQFSVQFPESLSPQICAKLEGLLPPK